MAGKLGVKVAKMEVATTPSSPPIVTARSAAVTMTTIETMTITTQQHKQ